MTDVLDELLDLTGRRIEGVPVLAQGLPEPGCVITAAWPMPFRALIELSIPYECSPRHLPSANTRALICRWR